MRWWSTLEASWLNWTIFDEGAGGLKLVETVSLGLDNPVVGEAAEFLGLVR